MRVHSWRVKENHHHNPFAPEDDVAGLLGITKTPKANRHKRRWSLFSQKNKNGKGETSKHVRSVSSGSIGTGITVQTRDLSHAGSSEKFDLTCIATNSDGSPLTPLQVTMFDGSSGSGSASMERNDPSFEEAVVVETLSDRRDDSLAHADYAGIHAVDGLSCIVEETSSKDVSDFDRLSTASNKLRKQAFEPFPMSLFDTTSGTWEEYGEDHGMDKLNDALLNDTSKNNGKRSKHLIPSEQNLTDDGFPEMILMDANSFTLGGSGTVWTDMDDTYSSGVDTRLQQGICMQLGIAEKDRINHLEDDLNYTYSQDSTEKSPSEVEALKDGAMEAIFDCTKQGELISMGQRKLIMGDSNVNKGKVRVSVVRNQQEQKDIKEEQVEFTIDGIVEQKDVKNSDQTSAAYSGNGVEESKDTDTHMSKKKTLEWRKKVNEMFPEDTNPLKLFDEVVNTMNSEYSKALGVFSNEKNKKAPSFFDNVAAVFHVDDPFPEGFFKNPKNQVGRTRVEI